MKTSLATFAVAFAMSFVLAGCAGTSPDPGADHNHPASPHAAASPVPPLEAGLLNLTNATVAPVTAAPTEHQHGDK